MSVAEIIKEAPPQNGTYTNGHTVSATKKKENPVGNAWKQYEKILFRIGFIFFVAISRPAL